MAQNCWWKVALLSTMSVGAAAGVCVGLKKPVESAFDEMKKTIFKTVPAYNWSRWNAQDITAPQDNVAFYTAPRCEMN